MTLPSYKIRHHEIMTREESPKFELIYGQLNEIVEKALELTIYLSRNAEVKKASEKSDHYFSPFLLITEFIDLVDGIGLLIKSGSSACCTPLLRSTLEVFLGLKYMVSDPAEFEKRSISYEYLFCFIHSGTNRGRKSLTVFGF